MNWFTIFVEWPRRNDPQPPAIPNSAGQLVAYDGKTSREQAVKLALTCGESWSHVELFQGKSIGRRLLTIDEGTITDEQGN